MGTAGTAERAVESPLARSSPRTRGQPGGTSRELRRGRGWESRRPGTLWGPRWPRSPGGAPAAWGGGTGSLLAPETVLDLKRGRWDGEPLSRAGPARQGGDTRDPETIARSHHPALVLCPLEVKFASSPANLQPPGSALPAPRSPSPGRSVGSAPCPLPVPSQDPLLRGPQPRLVSRSASLSPENNPQTSPTALRSRLGQLGAGARALTPRWLPSVSPAHPRDEGQCAQAARARSRVSGL